MVDYMKEFEKRFLRTASGAPVYLPLAKAIKMLEDACDEERIIDSTVYWGAKQYVLEELGGVSRETFEEVAAELKGEIEKLEAKLRNHRHDVSKLYSDTAKF